MQSAVLKWWRAPSAGSSPLHCGYCCTGRLINDVAVMSLALLRLLLLLLLPLLHVYVTSAPAEINL